jgi:preprotein translocase subunit SecD
MEANTADVAKQRLELMEETIRTEARRASPRIEIGDTSIADGRLSFMVRDPAQVDAAVEIARNQTQPVGMGGQRTWNVSVIDTSRVIMTPTEAGLQEALDQAMNTAREVVFNRVDPEGTKETTVIRQGSDRILVQVPGLEDPEGLKALLGKTARLEFKLVAPDQSGVQTGRAGPNTQILPMKDGGRIAVDRRSMVTGDQLTDAQQGFDPTTNEPVVTIRFDTNGARRFGRVTQQNVGKPFAIILDNVVLSAPNINEPILGGSAQISGSFDVTSANELAVQLRSGKLPVELKVVEERTVGPDLGPGVDRERRDRRHRRQPCHPHLHVPDLWPLRPLCRHRADPEHRRDPRHHGDLQRHPDAARHRRLRADRRRGRGRERDHQRAHPRGAEARPQGARRGRARL